MIGACLLALVFVQIGLGGLVAGLRAGLTYNTWPLMDGRFVPPLEHLVRLSPWWSNLLDNVTTVQFAHRMIAYCVLALAILQVIAGKRALGRGPAYRRAHIVFGLVLLQVIAGITTLLLVVPISVALRWSHAAELSRRGIAAQQIGPYAVRGAWLTRFVSQAPSTAWLAIHVLRSGGKTLIFFVFRTKPATAP